MPKKPSAHTPSGKISPADFPALRDFLRGYFHQDLEDEYGSPEAAARQFAEDADPAQRQAVAREWSLLQSRTKNLSLDRINRMLGELGSAWMFNSLAEIQTVAEISGQGGRENNETSQL